MRTMEPKNLNSTRAGRSIVNLDDRRRATTNPGNDDKTGNEMPHYEDEILEEQETAALDHVQVSAIADEAEDGETSVDESVRPART
jgi:hypothetical protein